MSAEFPNYSPSLRPFTSTSARWRVTMTDDPQSPIEENVEDPDLQDNSPDLPAPLEGNEDEDDTEEKQDQQTG
jgi:hypothetical protein